VRRGFFVCAVKIDNFAQAHEGHEEFAVAASLLSTSALPSRRQDVQA
jgi:hypothetical protein